MVLISCSNIGTKENIREVSSLKSVNAGSVHFKNALQIASSWINIPQAEIENTSFDIQRGVGNDSKTLDIALNVGLTRTTNENTVPDERHLTFFIDDSIHDHRLGDKYVQVIMRAAWVWENSVNEDVFTIHERYDESITLEEQPRMTSFIYDALGNFVLDRVRDAIESDDSVKFDGISKIYYVKDRAAALWFAYGYYGGAYPAYDLDWRSVFSSFSFNKRILEADITMNGLKIETTEHCPGHRVRNLDFLKNMEVTKWADKCAIYKFMIVFLHEMGHTLMLRHNEDENSVMNTTSSLWDADFVEAYDTGRLHQVDIDAFNEGVSLF